MSSRATPATHAKHPHIDRYFRKLIVSGRLRPGQQIPTYDKIAEKFSVSRATIVEAITTLKDDGYLVSGGPRGVFVAEHLPNIRNVGLVLHDDISDPATQSTFVKHVVQACEEEMAGRPGNLKIYNGLRREAHNEAYQMLLADLAAYRMGNLIFVHSGRELADTAAFTQENICRVMVTYDTPMPDVPTVYIDQQNFIDRSLEHLRSQGCKRIGLLLSGDSPPDGPMVQVWRDRIENRGMTTRDDWIHHVSFRSRGWANNIIQAVCRRDPSERPDGLVITDDHVVADVAQGLIASKLIVPDDIHVVAYANFPWPVQVDLPFVQMGMDLRMLVRHCFDALDRQRHHEPCPKSVRLSAILGQGSSQ